MGTRWRAWDLSSHLLQNQNSHTRKRRGRPQPYGLSALKVLPRRQRLRLCRGAGRHLVLVKTDMLGITQSDLKLNLPQAPMLSRMAASLWFQWRMFFPPQLGPLRWGQKIRFSQQYTKTSMKGAFFIGFRSHPAIGEVAISSEVLSPRATRLAPCRKPLESCSEEPV